VSADASRVRLLLTVTPEMLALGPNGVSSAAH
jgi:hypothetical protein